MFHAHRRRPYSVGRRPRPVRWLISTGGVTACAVVAALGAAPAPAAAAPTASCPWADSSQPVATRVTELLSHMTLADEITLVEGHGTTEPYVFYTPAIPDLCIPAIGEEDGPAGVADQLTGATQLPAGVALAATFDQSLATRYGKVIGSEEAGKGAAVNLGPTVNIDRDPRWGRSFETLAEDPFLSGTIGSSEIEGVQSEGEMSQVKHYDAYNQETNRNGPDDDVIVDPRVLHEIYEPSFEDAVKDAGAASVMCSYSSVNGPYACENPTSRPRRCVTNGTSRDLSPPTTARSTTSRQQPPEPIRSSRSLTTSARPCRRRSPTGRSPGASSTRWSPASSPSCSAST